MDLFEGDSRASLQKGFTVCVWLLALLIIAGIVYVAFSLAHMGQGVAAADTITVSGTGDAYAVPDTGEFSFTVSSDKATVAEAQADEAKKSKAVTDYLTGAGVAAKDLQTTNYSISPQYEYQNAACPVSSGVYCPPGRQVLTGYEVSQTTDVKVSDLSKVGTLLSGVGQNGATNVSSLSFTVADKDAVENQAEGAAILDAKTKAQVLANSLGVSLGKVVSFSETSSRLPMPVMFAASGAAESTAASTPTISAGQNKITSNVSVTYAIY